MKNQRFPQSDFKNEGIQSIKFVASLQAFLDKFLKIKTVKINVIDKLLKLRIYN